MTNAVMYDSPDHSSVTLGGEGASAPVALHNVARGDLSSTSTDAVNGSQLYETNQNVTNLGDELNGVIANGTKYFHANSTGVDSSADGQDSVAIGMGAVAKNTNDVALGAGSTTEAAVGTAGATIGGTDYAFAGANPTSTVSVGSVGNERTITNVAAGSLSAKSTDAVNGSQLYAANQAIEQINMGISDLDNNAVKYDKNPDGTLSHNSITLLGDAYNPTTRTGGTRITNVAAGVSGGDAVNKDQLDQVSKTANAGWIISAQNDNATNVVPGGSVDLNNTDQNIVVSKSATSNDVTFNLAKNLNVDSVTMGNTLVNQGGLTIQGGPGITTDGIDAGNKTITNVAAGVNGGDVVNKDQLDQVSKTASAGWTISAQGGNATNVAPTAAVDLSSTDKNIVVSKEATSNDVKFGLAQDLELNSITIGNTVLNQGGLTIQGGPSVTTGGINAGTKTITNLAAGVDDSDAVNVAQLEAVNDMVSNLGASSLKYDTNADGTVNHSSITLAGDTYNAVTHTGGTRITNVADGVNPSDAVNMSQLTETNSQINNVYTNGTKYFHANSTGVDSSADGQDSVAIGMGTVAKNTNDVALGAGSTTEAAVGTAGATIGGTDYAFAGANPTSTVSVGSVGNERTITNVAAGSLSATSTDAVNGSQLYATNQQVDANTTSITNLGDRLKQVGDSAATYDVASDGTVNHNSITLAGDTYNAVTHTGGTRITNVADGVNPSDAVNMSQLTETNSQINNVYTNGTKYFHANSTGVDSSADGQDSVAIGMGAMAKNTNDVALGAGSTTEAAVGTAGATIGGTDYGFAGANPRSTVSVGSVDNERTITNVAAGRLSATSTDAVNGSQLYTTNEALERINSNIANLDQGSVKYDRSVDGTVNYNSVTLGGGMSGGPVVLTNVANGTSTYDAVNFGQLSALQSQVSIIDNRVTNLESSSVDSRGASNPYFNATDTRADWTDGAVQHAAAPGAGSGSTTAGSGATVAGDYGTALGSSANAADDAVAVGSDATATSRSVAIGQGAQASATNAVALGQGSTADRDNAVSVGSATQQRQITNVAAGTQATDAVNVSQLTTVVNGLGGGAALNSDGSVTGPSYHLSGGNYSNVGDALTGLDERITGLDNRVNAADAAINDVAKGAYSGVAAATALTMIPDVDRDKTLSLGIGAGTYKGYQALAIGGTARITQNIKMRAGLGYSSGGTTAGVGASYQW
ncbi:YadA-like family protein [Paraburkholderia sp. MMS20-SJTR3]|uniref:YadA-like family protein n=1 Tax=Paraburkholderia sejongensis TaxID=2886946 RepID=A0ABS8K5X5_9BURK|nr:YadA-like family protein [Paraburkholderia sp. MMS20-SJTR3]MCC8397571.1 YadA-like family protein [Paraburkholderia sp. MMS20-SJTR3]